MSRIAVIGLGIMGGAIARNLIAAGHRVGGFDTDPVRLARLASDGVVACGSAAEAIRGAELTLTSLPTIEALDTTMAALAAAPQPGLVIAELSTMPLDVKQRAHDRLQAVGMTLLDCPLSGTGAQAVTRDLALYGSGDEAAYERARPVFDGFARVSHYLGPFGNGSRMKFVANLLVAIHNVASAEAMVLGMKAGLPPKLIFDLIKTGAGNSRIFELRAPMMVKNSYGNPTMKISVWQKDMDVIGSYARKIAVPTPMFDASKAIYAKALRSGHSAEDTAAVCAVLEKMAGVKRTKGRAKAA